MKALAAVYVAAAALAMPALLWAADDPPASDPAAASLTAPTTATAPPAATPEPPPAAPAKSATAPEALEVTTDVRPAPKARAASSTAVPIKDFAFKPAKVTVDEGDTVTWTNEDTAPHTATASDGTFDTGNLKKGSTGSYKFTKAGSFAYICSIHPNMKGTVVVKAATTDSGSGGDSSSSDSGSSDSSSSDSGSSDTFQLDSSSSDSGSSDSASLADTGGDPGTTVLLGLLLLATGVVLRRRVREI